jgi:hypothetical protein
VTEDELLRARLGEDIPPGGADTDTLFKDTEIADLVSAWGSADSAVARGWEIKAARLADLVDMTEGSTSRRMSKAFDHAMAMADAYSKGSLGDRKPRAVLHRIEREYGSF